MKISIIIPAYNVEKVIERCLDSVFNQDLTNNEFEVIVVDDESTDNTLQIVSSYIKEKENAILIKQKNQRQGAARNNALKIAKGEYIWFIDSDDYIKTNTLAYLYSIAKEKDLDLLCFNRKHIMDKFSSPITPALFKNGKIYNKIYHGQDFINFKSIYLGPCFCLYKRCYLKNNKILFKERLAHEDNEFMLKAYYYAVKAYYITDPIYYYDRTESSTTRTLSPQPIFDLIEITKYMLEFTNSIGKKDITKSSCHYYTVMTFNSAVAKLSTQSVTIKKEFIKNTKPIKMQLINSMFRSKHPKYISEGIVLFVSLKILLLISKVLR